MIVERALLGRLVQVADALDVPLGTATTSVASASAALATRIGPPDLQVAYLLLAVTSGDIPLPHEVVDFERQWRLTDAAAAIESALANARRANRWRSPTPVRIESGVIVDVNDTSRTPGTTGIQRVVRATLEHWLDGRELTLVAWNGSRTSPRTLRRAEAGLVSPKAGGLSAVEAIIPFRASWVLLEIATDQRRVDRSQAIALYAGGTTTAVGYDCIPMTSAETAGNGMPGRFARYLAALGHFTRVAPISGASAIEFEGFTGMLSGAGLAGPQLHTIDLPASSGPGPADADLVRAVGVSDEETLVLSVGSHEPRKNHLALLQAAELVWREGLEFTLVLVGGNSWAREEFDRAVADARARGRSVITLSGSSDATVWALYRRARFTVFASLNEGFGLPVVESISAGTPVITSDFGSMRESAQGFGGLLVDPHSDHDIAAAMRTLLTDDAVVDVLRAETANAPVRTWEQYARELWELCID